MEYHPSLEIAPGLPTQTGAGTSIVASERVTPPTAPVHVPTVNAAAAAQVAPGDCAFALFENRKTQSSLT